MDSLSNTCLILALIVMMAIGSGSGNDAKIGQTESNTVGVQETARNGTRKMRTGRQFPVFQIITFPNDPCQGAGSRNGTCYTAEECASRSGSSSGTCASSFGVCCVFVLSCGGMSSENCTFLVQESITSSPTMGSTPCTYTICRCSTNICRLRLDFNTFSIAGPQEGTTADTTTAPITTGGAIGDCVTDSFSITSPGNTGSPIICGFNTGQHLFVDASPSCNVANFDIGAAGDTRTWDIKVTQFECGALDAGPDNCLQFFTGTSGTVSSFNFPTTSATVAASTTHLSSQCYAMCFRREAGFCALCFTTAITNIVGDNTNDVDNAQSSFGLSISPDNAAAQMEADAGCSQDFLIIPNAEAGPVTIGTIPTGLDRLCGRTFSVIAISVITGASVCTQVTPFRVEFKTDADEVATNIGPAMGTLNEQNLAPGGIIGFSLNFMQISCT